MNKIKSILAFVALMLSGGAWAAMPIAVWEGSDFTGSGTKLAGGLNLVLPADATYEGGVVTIGSTGIFVKDNGNTLQGCQTATIIVKYSNYTQATSGEAAVDTAILSMGGDGTSNSADGNKDYIGMIHTADGPVKGMVSSVVWNNNGNTSTTMTPTRTGDANIALSYSYNADATRGIPQAFTSAIVENNDATDFLANTSIRGSGVRVRTFAIFGCYDKDKTGAAKAATGTKVKGIAIFNTALTKAEIAEYLFPSESGDITAEPSDASLLKSNSFIDTGVAVSSIDDLMSYRFTGIMSGGYVGRNIGTPASENHYRQVEGYNTFKVGNSVYVEYQTYDGGVKTVLAEFKLDTATGADHQTVHVRAVDVAYKNVTQIGYRYMTINDQGAVERLNGAVNNSGGNIPLATTTGGNGYGLRKIVAKRPNTGTTIKNTANVSGSEGWGNWTLQNFRIAPNVFGYPAGALLKIKSITVSENGTSGGVTHSDKLRINGVISDGKSVAASGTMESSGGKEVTYTFSTPVEVRVGKDYTINALNNSGSVVTTRLRVRSSFSADGYKIITADTINGTTYYPICSMEVEEVNLPSRQTAIARLADTASEWNECDWVVSTPVNGENADIVNSGDSEINVANETAVSHLTITGSGTLTIKNAQNLKFASFYASGLSGLTMEYDCTEASLTADAQLVNFIKLANGSCTFKFLGEGANGATINCGTVTAAISSHVVFSGGTHTWASVNNDGARKFGQNATADKPTVLVTDGATVTMNMKDPCGWSAGDATATGIIRVDDGSTLNLGLSGTSTFYWNQQFYIEPGATVKFTDNNDNWKFCLCGGANVNACQIYVPASDPSTGKVAKFIQEGTSGFDINGSTAGMAIFVGENSTLEVDAVANNRNTLTKYGTGSLIFKRACNVPLTVANGFIGKSGEGQYANLTISNGASVLFPADHAAETAYTLCTGTLTPPTTTTGVFVYFGTLLDRVNLTYNTTEKSVSYTLFDSASYNGQNYSLVSKALVAAGADATAQNQKTVTLLAASNETITIPENVILDTNKKAFTGTISGAGEIVYDGQGGTTVPSFTIGNEWTGVITIKNFGVIHRDGYVNNSLNDLFNFIGSHKVKFSGVAGYFNGSTYPTDLILEDGENQNDTTGSYGWRCDNGYSTTASVFPKLSGTGMFRGTRSQQQMYIFTDVSDFTGTIKTEGKRITLGGNLNSCTADAQIYVKTAATINTEWTATGGIIVDGTGTISGTGTIAAALTLKDGAAIDVTDNGEDEALTLGENATVSFGSSLKLVGADSGDVILKGILTRPDVEFITVKFGNENAPGHLAYSAAKQAIIYTEESADYWTPKASSEGGRIVFEWTTGSTWKDYNGQDAEWPSDGCVDGEKINVQIDAKDFAGVVINGQVMAGDVVVVCSDDQDHDFEFHNPTRTVDGLIEVDETNKLTANSILMPLHRGNLGLKVPIVGEIGFSDNTHLVFRTGTGSKISEAYRYNVNTHGAAIVVDLTNGEAGKFEVPSSMYAQKFEVKENATIVFKSTSIDITGVYSGAGKLAKMGEGTTALVSVNLPSGGVEVLEGTLKLNRGSTNYPFWNGTALPVMVADGATLDINGCEGFKSAITLEEGATLASDDAGRDLGYENASIYSISLNGNATVRAVGDFGILRNQRGDTSFALNGHKLTKTGAGIFHLCNTTVSSDSTGSIDVQAGRLAIWNKAVNVSSVDVAFADGTSLAMSANLTAHDITITGAVTITSDSTGTLSGSSIKLMTAESTLTVPTKLADDAVTTDLTGKIVVFNETTLQYSVSDAYVEKAFESVVGSSASGWFTDWSGEKEGAARSVITGSGLEQKRMVHHDGDYDEQKWHPYYGLSSKNAYTMSVYGTTDLIEPEADKYKVLWAMGNPGNSHILAKDEDGNIVFFKNSNGSGNTGTQSNKISAGKLSGYHLITVTFSTTAGAAIWVDGEKKASDSTFTTAANTGLQVGGVYQGTYSPMKQGVGYVPTYIWAAEAIAPDAQIAALSSEHPAVTTFNANVVFETNGGKVYLPSMTNTSGNLFQVKKGTLVVPSDVTATLDNIEFGDSQGSSYGLELDGTLNINKSSTDACTDASVYRNNSQNNGVLFGEWEGTGTYNIRGTFSAPNAWVDLIHDADNQTFKVDGGTFTVKGLTAKKAGATIELTNGGTLNLGTNPSMENIRIVKNLTNGTVNGNGAEYDTLNVTGAVSLKYGGQNIRSLNIANGGTATLVTNGDQISYDNPSTIHIKGTLDCGSTRQTLFAGSKIYLYNGGKITGEGGSNNGVTVGLDTDRDGAGVIICKNADVDSKIATITGSLGAHDANTGSNTITAQEGAEDVILSIPNAASLNGRMPWVIGEGVNVKFGAEKSVGQFTSLTINGNVVLDENVTEETTLVTVAEGKTITLGAGVKAVDPSLNELTRTVLAVEGLSLVAKTGETLITIDGNEYVSIDVALKHLHQDSTVELGTGVTLVDGIIHHGDQTFNPLDYLGYEIVVAEDGTMTANRVFEDSSEVGLMISEICPKTSAWDENHCDAGWLEVVNTSKKWVQFKDYSFARFNRGKEVKKLTDWKNNVTKALAPGERLVIKTSEEYPKADDKSVTQYGEDLGNVIVLAAKVNPKKYPLVILTKGGKEKQNCVVPVDVPENKSVCYDGELKNGAIVSYITTASKGEASNFTDAIAVGPQITSLYAVKDAPDPWIAFPQATVGSDYTVALPVNSVYGGNANNAIESVKLIYRIDYNNEIVVDTPMTKVSTDAVNGDMYTGTIPGTALTADGQLVRWAVKITDVGGNEWRSPSFNNPEDGFEYYGTITTPTEDQLSGGLNTMHLFADPDEVADGIGTQNTKGGNCLMNRDADDANYKTTRHPYGAYVGIYDSETGKYYDKVRIDKRGRTTGTMTKKAHGLKFAKAQPFIGTDALTGETIECRKSSFTAEFGDPTFIRQELAFEVMRRNGVKAPFHYPVRLNLNGQFYQLAFHSERFSDELIEDFYGLDGKGYAYKNVGPFHNGANNSSERKTPDDGTPDQTTNDPVLKAFCDTLNGAGSINENTDFSSINEFSADLSKVVAKSFDLPTWINYMAATKITAETDDVWANISAYYDINGTGTWMPLAYDMNQSLGQWHFGDDRARGRIGLVADIDNFKSHPFYGGLHIRMHKNSGEASGNPNYAYEAIFQNAKYRRLFLRRLRTIMDKEIGATAAATQAKEMSALFTSAAAMVAKINELGLKDRDIWTDYANVNFDTNADCSGNGSADKIWVWNQEMTENLRTPEGGLADLWTNYVKPRRAYLYGKHLASYTGEGQMEVGYGLTKSAGIPAAQSPIENLVNGIGATYNETLGVIVISNTNGEAVDMSGWELRGPIAMTLPMGTVIDQGTNETPATLYVTADRKALVTSLGDSIGDQLIVGNGTANAVDAPISLRTDAGVRVVGEPTAQELYLRVWGFSGQPNDCNDEGGEFVILTNIGEEELDASGAIFHSLKAGADPTTDSRCKIVLPPGTMIAAGATLRLNQDVNGELAWEKMTDGDLDITLYDSFGSPIQSWKTLTQKSIDGVSVKGTGKYAKYDFANEAWTTDDIENSPGHWFEGSTVSGAHLACIYIQATSDKAITFDNPTMKGKSRIKISGTATVTIDGTLTMSGVSTGIKSAGNLVFTDGSYTITAGDDCIQADGDITINGGTFICHSTGNDGIDSNQDIVINGGTIFAFTAATEEDDAKSTGLDVNSGHSITINGGTVIATSLSKKALEDLTIADGSQVVQIVEVSDVSGATKAIGDVIVTFPTMDPAPTAVLVSTPTLTDAEITPEGISEGIELVAADGDAPAKSVVVPASWAADKTDEQKVAAAEAYVLGLAEPTEKPMVSSEQTTEADSIRIVDNVAPRFGTGVTVKRTLFVGTTPEASEESSVKESGNGFTVPLPIEGEKVKYIKIKYSFK